MKSIIVSMKDLENKCGVFDTAPLFLEKDFVEGTQNAGFRDPVSFN